MTVTDTAKPANNPMPASCYDRYYLIFSGASPTAASVDIDASTAAIAQGASIEVTTTGRILVTFGEGADVSTRKYACGESTVIYPEIAMAQGKYP